MTNAELIQKIRAEIERRYDGEAPKHDQQCNFDDGYFVGIDAIAQFLDTLESEKPMNQEGLEGEIENAWENLEKDYSPSALDKTRILVSGLVGEKQFSKIAHHFAKWGAEHLKK